MKKDDTLIRLKTQVFNKQAVLKQVYGRYGQDSLFDYVNNWQIPENSQESSQIFFNGCGELLEELYGKNIAQVATSQLKQSPLVSTIDHHGLLNHPFFLNSNLIFSLRKGQEYLICFSTAGISLNNSSWPGSLVLTDKHTGGLKRFSFFPDKQKTKVVLALPAFKEANVQIAVGRIKQDKNYSRSEKEQLCQTVEEIFLDKEILSLPTFSKQASVVSARLWKKIFPAAPVVLYLPIEELASKVIIEEIAQNPSHILYQLFFTKPGNELVHKYFQNNLGAFSSGHKGSFLFWGINKQGRRVHLRREGKELTDGDFSISIEPEIIAAALKSQQLYPTSLVSFLVLLYYQVTCLGGFNQVNWLTGIKDKFAALLKEAGESDLANNVAGAETVNFAEGNLAFLLQQGQIIKATGMDVLVAQDNQLYGKYQRLAGLLTVGESIESLLPEIYRVITPAHNREKELMALTSQEIVAQNGMRKKIIVGLVP